MQKTKQKNAMWVKTEDSALFEEAYFLLKEKAAPLGDSEMVKEANRIIAAFESKGLPQKKKRERRTKSPFFYFLSGMVCALLFFGFSGFLLIILH